MLNTNAQIKNFYSNCNNIHYRIWRYSYARVKQIKKHLLGYARRGFFQNSYDQSNIIVGMLLLCYLKLIEVRKTTSCSWRHRSSDRGQRKRQAAPVRYMGLFFQESLRHGMLEYTIVGEAGKSFILTLAVERKTVQQQPVFFISLVQR